MSVSDKAAERRDQLIALRRETGRVYLAILAEEVDRQPNTIRTWENGLLPADLFPERDERGWRYWTEDQVERIKRWMKDENVGPGRGLIIARQARQAS